MYPRVGLLLEGYAQRGPYGSSVVNQYGWVQGRNAGILFHRLLLKKKVPVIISLEVEKTRLRNFLENQTVAQGIHTLTY
jgi:hypothetical protein